MEGDTYTFDGRACPHCGDTTTLVHLGGEPPREVCPTLTCGWDGETLTPESEAVG